ncbi:hypothetical protein [Sediminicurvatus halobius]|uniref:DUF2568 domain-containing protein n=1 Tax=Sediminicurvatus halobius TaxID=2182432 RepID=A0A2U2N4P8_9GAMM|nr:hypothetical protein [Spiribacter halobius]PWG63964.1 hypothetical protein DEM34_07155 [Spiribacter halobius]UEX76380.1 hypothetical protein LMH63_10425 [Spiribacter halobius]
MTDTLSLTATREAATAHVQGFRSLFGLVLALEALAGLAMLAWPQAVVAALGADAGGLVPLAGGLLLWTVLLQVPGQLDPVHSRLPVVLGIIGRLGVGVVALFLGFGPALAGLCVIVFALALLFVYHRMVAAVIMSRP